LRHHCLLLLFAIAIALPLAADTATAASTPTGTDPMSTKTLHDFRVRTIEGKDQALSAYKGQVLLVVNTASRCGFTPQYEGLERLHSEYRERGFRVLGFPANDFMGQEPGTNAEIQSFCSTNYKISFPMYEKISVKGKKIAPLYQWLTKESAFPGDISWNFNKFLVGPDGRVVARFGSSTKPESEEVRAAIERLLPAQR
jgi:glutathione peroxidase